MPNSQQIITIISTYLKDTNINCVKRSIQKICPTNSTPKKQTEYQNQNNSQLIFFMYLYMLQINKNKTKQTARKKQQTENITKRFLRMRTWSQKIANVNPNIFNM